MREPRTKTLPRPTPAPPAEPLPLPPLEPGDRLARAEFERRYEAMPLLKKAELIEGRVYLPSPVKPKTHGRPHALILIWLGAFLEATLGVVIYDNTTLRLDDDNEPQPDAILAIDPEFGGGCVLDGDEFLSGPPELVVEVAGTSAAYDMHEKLRTYERHGVQEYLVWRVRDRQVSWFKLVDGVYMPLMPDSQGLLHSEVFPGLVLDVEALIAGDIRRVLLRQRRAFRTSAYRRFAAELKSRQAETRS
jgi:Uma2 family endonuclease